MKKTLAVILAAAMAASMSTVAFAKNYDASINSKWEPVGGISGKGDTITISKEVTYGVELDDIDLDGISLSKYDLARLMEDGYVSGDIIITSGKEKLATLPTLKVLDTSNGPVASMKIKFKDTWGVGTVEAKVKARFTAKKTVCEYYTVEVDNLILAEDTNPGNIDGYWLHVSATPAQFSTAEEAERIAKKVIKAYNDTSGIPATLDNKDIEVSSVNEIMKKGDTITSNEFTVTGKYHDVAAYGETITMTPTEHSNREIIARGDDLYDYAGSGDKVTLYFGPNGDVASFTFKVSTAQKDLNLGFDTNEIKDVVEAYPTVDFEFINFKSTTHNVLTNSATGVFNAIGGKNTTVYEWDGKTLTERNGKYDSVDDTIVVENIKRLTSFVVSEKELVAETKATEATEPIVEPEPEAPATEAPAPSAPSNNDNPTTGAL